jgi:Putative bacterial sensory transduction regulator
MNRLLLMTGLLAAEMAGQSGGVLTTLTNAKLEQILRGMGVEFTEKKSALIHSYTIRMKGEELELLGPGKEIRLIGVVRKAISLERVNEWNGGKHLGRAYRDARGMATIEDDLHLGGGLTQASVEAFLVRFTTTWDSFREFVLGPVSSAPGKGGKRVKTVFGEFSVVVDERKWILDTAEGGEQSFNHVNGEAYAKLISERTSVPLEVLRDAALANMKKKDPKVKIVREETRTVSGRSVLRLEMMPTIQQIPFHFVGYLYGGGSGSVQVWAFATESSYAKHMVAFSEFLNGLEISDQPAPAARKADGEGLLRLGVEDLRVRFDPRKWTSTEAGDTGRFSLKHKAGDGYGLVIVERVPIPLDSFPAIALENAKKADPNAKITLQEKRKVNGLDVWFLKMEAVVKGIPLSYRGYYYGGEKGAVQLLTFTSSGLLGEYESDFLALLNGLGKGE